MRNMLVQSSRLNQMFFLNTVPVLFHEPITVLVSKPVRVMYITPSLVTNFTFPSWGLGMNKLRKFLLALLMFPLLDSREGQ